jgi:hypothetical protein
MNFRTAVLGLGVLIGFTILLLALSRDLNEQSVRSLRNTEQAAVTPWSEGAALVPGADILTPDLPPPTPSAQPPAPALPPDSSAGEPDSGLESTPVPDSSDHWVPDGPLDQVGTLWAPFLEWSLENTTYSGNPFDLEAWATFAHQESGEVRRTGMFFAGDDVWKFRFTGTRTGEWHFVTSSPDPDLDGHSGRVLIQPNPDPNIKGFLVNHGNRFAYQVGENGDLEAFIFNVWQGGSFREGEASWIDDPDPEVYDRAIEEYVEKHGMSVIFSGTVNNRWFDINAIRWDEHDSVNPDLRTFERLEKAIVHFHKMGYHMHIWMWGDEDRRWTQIGVGGINGEPDRRLQRYIAARLGPLPGWSMSYGFDLGESNWIGGDTDKLETWATYMQERMGWPHLLFSRGYAPSAMSGVSYSSNGPGHHVGDIQTSANGPASYEEVVSHIDSDPNRPHLYEERFIYLREFDGAPPWTTERTLQVLWWNTMAGGVGAFWGVWDGPMYPKPEPLKAHAQFWEGRFLLDMERANHLTDGYALRSAAEDKYVFYKEETDLIVLDLADAKQPLHAVAVDTRIGYEEISLGLLDASVHTWEAPYVSDWSIAVGFED